MFLGSKMPRYACVNARIEKPFLYYTGLIEPKKKTPPKRGLASAALAILISQVSGKSQLERRSRRAVSWCDPFPRSLSITSFLLLSERRPMRLSFFS